MIDKEIDKMMVEGISEMGEEKFRIRVKEMLELFRDSHIMAIIETLIKKKIISQKEYTEIFQKILEVKLDELSHPEKMLSKELITQLAKQEKIDYIG